MTNYKDYIEITSSTENFGKQYKEYMKKLFATRLYLLIQAKGGINQKDLAEALNVSESTVGKWLLRKAMPRIDVIQRIADYFGVEKSYFLEENGTQDKIIKLMQYSISFSEEEMQLIEDFRRLNNDGQKAALNTVHAYTLMSDYAKKEESEAASI